MSLLNNSSKSTSKLNGNKSLENFKSQETALDKEEMQKISGGKSNQNFVSFFSKWPNSICSNIMYQ